MHQVLQDNANYGFTVVQLILVVIYNIYILCFCYSRCNDGRSLLVMEMHYSFSRNINRLNFADKTKKSKVAMNVQKDEIDLFCE